MMSAVDSGEHDLHLVTSGPAMTSLLRGLRRMQLWPRATCLPHQTSPELPALQHPWVVQGFPVLQRPWVRGCETHAAAAAICDSSGRIKPEPMR